MSISAGLQPKSDGLQPNSDGSNLRAVASKVIVMASNLRAVASKVIVMASNLMAIRLAQSLHGLDQDPDSTPGICGAICPFLLEHPYGTWFVCCVK